MEEAEAIARQTSREMKMIVWLVYARGQSRMFTPEGEEFASTTPVMQIGGFRRQVMALAKRAAAVPVEPPAVTG